jgi:carboxymethylenebutenolidase
VEKQIVIESPDGTFGAYISRPTTLPAPVVVVLQELFGVNADIRVTCDELAAKDTSQSRQTSSGGRSLTLILT